MDPITIFGGFLTLWMIIWLVGGVFVLITTIFWIIEIVDVVRREFGDPTIKIVWLLIIVFTHFIGAMVYFFVGKRQGYLPEDAPPPVGQGPPRY